MREELVRGIIRPRREGSIVVAVRAVPYLVVGIGERRQRDSRSRLLQYRRRLSYCVVLRYLRHAGAVYERRVLPRRIVLVGCDEVVRVPERTQAVVRVIGIGEATVVKIYEQGAIAHCVEGVGEDVAAHEVLLSQFCGA